MPGPRDNGTPGAASDRPGVVRVDPESGMPIEKRRRPSILPSGPPADIADSEQPALPGGATGG